MDKILKYCQKYQELATAEKGWKEQIPGGLSAGRKPEDFDPEQLAKGIKVELEHTKDPRMALEISMDHLMEDSHYYDHLEDMESKFEGEDK